ncbi:MAG: hypothetical protein DCC75_06165 [Proteobacteria bacterium]|nr:MAG: hypothetical protein DCC75_06165 [Pseudomonadota bacterium]
MRASGPRDASLSQCGTGVQARAEVDAAAASLRQAHALAEYLYQAVKTALPEEFRADWIKRCGRGVESNTEQLRTSNNALGILMADGAPYRVFGSFGALPIGRALSKIPKEAMAQAVSHALLGLKLEVLMPEFSALSQRVGSLYWVTADMNDDSLPKPEFA